MYFSDELWPFEAGDPDAPVIEERDPTPPPTLIYERPPLYPKQRDAIFTEKRYSLIEASTKSGKTVGCLMWLWEMAVTNGAPGRQFWWVAPVYGQALIAFNRLVSWLPEELISVKRSAGGDGLTITFKPNGAIISFKSGERPDGLYGEDVWAAVIDEASRCREEVFFAVRSTLTATRGPLRMIGNVKGRKNWFFKLSRIAEKGDDEAMHYARITALDAVAGGVLDIADIEDAKRLLPAAVFQELYEALASDDNTNPFGLQYIERAVMSESDWMLRAQYRVGNALTVPVAWGWDLARKRDWTVGVGLNAEREVCRLIRFQHRPWRDVIKNILHETAKTPALVDETGVGDPIVEELRQQGGELYEGFTFSQRSKQHLMEELAVTLQQDTRPRFPDGILRHELEAFEYEYTRTGVI
ncbi:MAG TPA: terminase family protein, partial [Gemmatimonadaceae bacterium]|nr:terminase family protein [Gemmatimonadaceae bacterium]